jgi:hypothetical protein
MAKKPAAVFHLTSNEILARIHGEEPEPPMTESELQTMQIEKLLFSLDDLRCSVQDSIQAFNEDKEDVLEKLTELPHRTAQLEQDFYE